MNNKISKIILDEKIVRDKYIFTKSFLLINNARALLINKLNGTTILLDRTLVKNFYSDWYNRIDDNLFLKLFQRKFIEKKEQEKQCFFRYKPTFFLIDITQKCNFDCIYCFRNLNRNIEISDKTLLDICDFIIDYCKINNLKRITIQPWGGEPLLAYKKIIFIYEKITKCGIKVDLTIETNGSIVNDEIVNFIKNNNVHLGISIDGPAWLHNAQRKSKNSNYNEIVKNIKYLRNNKINKISAICVVTNKGIEYIEKIIEAIINDFKIKNLKINLVHNTDFKKNDIYINKILINRFASNLYNAVRKSKNKVREGNIEQRINNILFRDNSNICLSNGCRGGYKMVSFSSNGDIFPCELIDYYDEKIGSIYDGVDLPDMIQTAIDNKKYFKEKYDEKCDDCPWWYYCRGGCTSGIRYAQLGAEIDEVGCIINTVIYELIVRDILQKGSEFNE